MKRFGSRRLLILSAIATGILVAGTWMDEGNGRAMEVVVTAAPERHRAPPDGTRDAGSREPAGANDLERWRERRMSSSFRDAFAARSWDAPSAPARQRGSPSAAPSASAQESQGPGAAPQLPFTYVGKLVDQGRTMVFLSRQDRNYTAREGDILDNTYRVDEIQPTVINMTYIPLNAKQTMMIGEPK